MSFIVKAIDEVTVTGFQLVLHCLVMSYAVFISNSSHNEKLTCGKNVMYFVKYNEI